MIKKISKIELRMMTDDEVRVKIDELIEAMKPFECKYSWEPKIAYPIIYNSYKGVYYIVKRKNVVT